MRYRRSVSQAIPLLFQISITSSLVYFRRSAMRGGYLVEDCNSAQNASTLNTLQCVTKLHCSSCFFFVHIKNLVMLTAAKFCSNSSPTSTLCGSGLQARGTTHLFSSFCASLVHLSKGCRRSVTAEAAAAWTVAKVPWSTYQLACSHSELTGSAIAVP